AGRTLRRTERTVAAPRGRGSEVGRLWGRGQAVPDHRYQLQGVPVGNPHPGAHRPGAGATAAGRHRGDRFSARVDVRRGGAADGRRVEAKTSHPKGHYRNPLTDEEVEGKFRGLASGVLGAEGCDRVLREVWNLENAPTLDRLFESLVISRRRTSP